MENITRRRGPRVGKARMFNAEQVEQIRADYTQGLTLHETAAKWSCSWNTIRRVVAGTYFPAGANK